MAHKRLWDEIIKYGFTLVTSLKLLLDLAYDSLICQTGFLMGLRVGS